MPIRVVTPPAVEPVTNEQAMLWCRAIPEDTTLLDVLIQAARERAENTTQRVFVQRTLEWTGPGFYATPGDWRHGLGLGSSVGGPYGFDHYFAKLSESIACGLPQIFLAAPVLSIESVKYLDAAGVEHTLDNSTYVLDAVSEPAMLRYVTGGTLPTVIANRSDAVRVRFVAGYPADVTDPNAVDYRKNLPSALIAWMQIQISTYYNQRESLETGGRLVETSRNFVEALLDGLIVSTRFV